MKGWYLSDAIPIVMQGDGALNSLSWEADVPEGTSIEVQTSVSFDGGYDWTPWTACVSGGSIPALTPETYLGNAHLRFRVFLNTAQIGIVPVFKRLWMEFIPVLVFNNEGDTFCKPELWITKTGQGAFTITNTSYGNRVFAFDKLADKETVYISNERQYIESDLAISLRYENFNDNYLELPAGVNILRLEGDADLKIRYEFKLLQ